MTSSGPWRRITRIGSPNSGWTLRLMWAEVKSVAEWFRVVCLVSVWLSF